MQRVRKKHRSGKAAHFKETFQVSDPLVIHFDRKLLPAINGAPEKEERVSILISVIKFEKLLEVPKVQRGTGKLEAEVTASNLQDWRLTEEIAAMSFDTTAVNTGRINGACISLEELLNKKLLLLACRHHILEEVFSEVFKKNLVKVQQDRMFCYSSALRLFCPK